MRWGFTYAENITVTPGLQNIQEGWRMLAGGPMRPGPEKQKRQAIFGLPLYHLGDVVAERFRPGQLSSSLCDWPVALRYARTACTRACCPFSEAIPSLLKMLLIWCSTVLG